MEILRAALGLFTAGTATVLGFFIGGLIGRGEGGHGPGGMINLFRGAGVGLVVGILAAGLAIWLVPPTYLSRAVWASGIALVAALAGVLIAVNVFQVW